MKLETLKLYIEYRTMIFAERIQQHYIVIAPFNNLKPASRTT